VKPHATALAGLIALAGWHSAAVAGEMTAGMAFDSEVIAAAEVVQTSSQAASATAPSDGKTEATGVSDAVTAAELQTSKATTPSAAEAASAPSSSTEKEPQAAVAAGAASAPAAQDAANDQDLPPDDANPVNPRDPYESLNRKVYDFNTKLDDHVMKPVAQVYHDVVPGMVRTGVSNVLGNLGDVWSIVNHLLQGKLEGAVHMTMRVATNTVFGLGGIFDQATELGIDKESEDFGQTLGRWGVPPGPYVVLPLLGPSTARDTVAEPFDLYFGPSYFVDGTAASWEVSALNAVSTRAGLLGASQILNEVALDPYSFLRDAYLARRRNQVYDGNPPDDDDSDGGDSYSR
jgi:phospholipid-binding lipoprotein MlaA